MQKVQSKPILNNESLIKVLPVDARLYSFDVFDTAIVRNLLSPAGVFCSIQHKLSKQHDLPFAFVQNFVQLRFQAEKTVYANKQSDFTIFEIYDVIRNQFSLSNEQKDFLVTLEMSEELNSVKTVEEISQTILSLRNRGSKVVFMSDTHLPFHQIQLMLKKAGVWETNDSLYTSSEFNGSKSSGALFSYALKKESCMPRDLVHVGDNPQSDFINPKKLGIRSYLFKVTEMNRYERAILGGDFSLESYAWQSLAGISHSARLAIPKKNGASYSLFCLGSNVVGPIFLGFILWVLNQAKEHNIKRLFFVARDGQILLEIAQRIASKMNLQIDMRYLYGSRQAWHIASLTEPSKRDFEWLLDKPVSIRALSNRSGIDLKTIHDELEAQTGQDYNVDVYLDDPTIAVVKQLLNSKFRSTLIKQAEQARISALGYFRQEGLLDGESCGVVDLGWEGNCQDSLQKILDFEDGCNRLNGFYFGLWRPCSAGKSAFFDCSYDERSLNTVKNFALILEVFASADHGKTMRYSKNGDTYCAELSKQVSNNMLSWLKYLREGIFKFIDGLSAEVLSLLLDSKRLEDYKRRIVTCMEFLGFNPDLLEAEAIGDCPYSVDQAETYLVPFAPKFSPGDFLRYISTSDWSKKQNLTRWVDGTRIRSKGIQHFLLSPKIRSTATVVKNPKNIKNVSFSRKK